ncbi:MAG: choice-of-anchor U domain-containing protein [Burkholderiales bacterium]
MTTKWIGAIVGALMFGMAHAAAIVPNAESVPLEGHVLPVLAEAKAAPEALSSSESVTLTVVMRYRDLAGFERYYADVYDPASPNFRKFLSAGEIADRFGATRDDYAAVEAYFLGHGFAVSEASSNRLTLTLRGTREAAERALSVRINDYTLDTRTFYANDTDPRLPAGIAARVQAVVGLSNLAMPTPQWNAIVKAVKSVLYQLCKLFETPVPGSIAPATGGGASTTCDFLKPLVAAPEIKAAGPLGLPVPWRLARGNGQKVGIVAFDSYVPSDVASYLALMGFPASQMSKLSQVHVNGGAPLGANQPEVLLDITTILTTATGASVVVFDGPFAGGNTSFQSIFNAMITNNVTIISNSWAYCENQTTLADVNSIDTIFMTAAAAGITVFNATGDSGSTCLNGAPNTITVPAGSPNATAVGGTSLAMGPGSTYVSETWWDGASATPQTGRGGFGVSKFFSRPAYQSGFTASATRSIPDVAINADPANGSFICQASGGGCPTGQLWGGTSASAPIWAALAAQINEAQGTNLGFLNPQLYALAGTTAFHDAASMGSDFAHVGLGSPNSNRIHLALSGQSVGAPSASTSSVVPYADWYTPYPEATAPAPPADGTTPIKVVVWLRDANGNMVSGKTVSLTANPPAGVTITPASGVTSVANGAVVFNVTNTTPGTVTFTATDVTDNLALTPQAVKYAVPPAASGGIGANPSSVLNNGVATTTITVTLIDALSRPTPGKFVTLSQGSGHSIVTGPSPAVTNANGQIQFTATNLFAETVTYTATDVTDGNLPIPGSAVVDFTGQPTTACANPPPSVAAPGYTLTLFSSGYVTGNVFYGNVNAGCRGVQNPAFTVDGAVLTSNFVDGTVYRLPRSGGIADTGARIATFGPSLFQPVTGKDGRVYIARMATTGNFTTGAIYEIDPATGATLRTVMGGLTCPTALAVDPLSGDLFYDDSCFGAGADDPAIYRVSNPASASPVKSSYYTLPATPAGWLAFAPDGTLFVPQFVTGAAPVLRITGTDKPQPATSTVVPGLDTLYWVTVGEANPDGSAKSLIVLQGSKIRLANITTNPPTFTDLIDNGLGSGIVGPDGCLYIGALNAVWKLSLSSGGCGFATSVPVPALNLTPTSASQAQGSTQTLTAQFTGPAPATGTPVHFTVTGPNARTLLGTTNASGQATVSYPGQFTGTDAVKASATVSATVFASNSAAITWGAGKHLSTVSLNPAPSSGTLGVLLQLRAQLLDSSVTPNAPIAGASVQLALGAQSCIAVTDAQGFASCPVTPGSAGTITLTATYAGSSSYTASSASTQVVVVAALASLTASPASVDFGNVAVGATSAPVAVQVTNSGTAAYTPTSIALGGAQPGDFLQGSGANACAVGTPIAANGNCFLYPAFKPTATGVRSATLTLSDGTSPLAIPLAGTGIAAPPSCVTGPVPGGNATACITGTLPACTFSSASFVPLSSVPAGPPAGVQLPWGLLQFQATGCGAQATVVITYPATLPAGANYYKYGPTAAQPADHWYTLPSTVAGNTITVTFADGGAGDSDLTVDGTIRDPGGAGFVQAPPPVVTNVPTLDRWGLAILALALLTLAGGRLRRGR